MVIDNDDEWQNPVVSRGVSRRTFVRVTGALGAATGFSSLLPAYSFAPGLDGPAGSMDPLAPVRPRTIAGVTVYDLSIAETAFGVGGRRARATTINGTVPGPLLRLREGDTAIIRVTNRLREDTSVHWHGVIVPMPMDGVPGVSFPGIRPGQTFHYEFPLKQYGTYWYHSHSSFQEQLGHYGPMIIEPAGGRPYKFDREYIVMLSDWTFEDPHEVFDNLKKQGNYYNFQRRTVGDFFRDASRNGFGKTVRERLMWARMRMDPTDIMDVTGATYTFLMNGLDPNANWTGLFRPGERVLLHFINAGAATYFDVRIPGLPMRVVEVSGQHVQPVETDEIRIANAETYAVIVEPKESRAYTVFAEAMDRSGYARGTLAPRQGMIGPVPKRRPRPTLTMSDMGMDMAGMDMEGMDMPRMDHSGMAMQNSTTDAKTDSVRAGSPSTAGASGMANMPAGHSMPEMPGMPGMPGMEGMSATDTSNAVPGAAGESARMAIAGATWSTGLRAPGTLPTTIPHEPSTHGPGNSAVPMVTRSRLSEPGPGLGADGWRVLLYTDLRALEKRPAFRAPERELELHLTGNMERFMWSIDGKPFKGSEPIRFTYGERLRFTMVNDTMMNHPMHLHGMWMELENGHGTSIPRVHTVNVKPAERLSLLITADAPGRWAFHCHILYHMDAGMFRVVEVSPATEAGSMGGGAHAP